MWQEDRSGKRRKRKDEKKAAITKAEEPVTVSDILRKQEELDKKLRDIETFTINVTCSPIDDYRKIGKGKSPITITTYPDIIFISLPGRCNYAVRTAISTKSITEWEEIEYKWFDLMHLVYYPEAVPRKVRDDDAKVTKFTDYAAALKQFEGLPVYKTRYQLHRLETDPVEIAELRAQLLELSKKYNKILLTYYPDYIPKVVWQMINLCII